MDWKKVTQEGLPLRHALLGIWEVDTDLKA